MKWITAKRRSGILGGRCFRTQPAIGVEIIASELCALQRKRFFIAPMATVAELAVLGFSTVPATHDKELHGRLLVDAVVHGFEPMIEPSQSPAVGWQDGFRGGLD